MLAYYVEFHLREALAPVLYHDDDKTTAHHKRTSIVAPAQRSDQALAKDRTKRTNDDLPVHSFQTLLRNLATITKNTIQPRINHAPAFTKTSLPTPFQRKVFDLLQMTAP